MSLLLSREFLEFLSEYGKKGTKECKRKWNETFRKRNRKRSDWQKRETTWILRNDHHYTHRILFSGDPRRVFGNADNVLICVSNLIPDTLIVTLSHNEWSWSNGSNRFHADSWFNSHPSESRILGPAKAPPLTSFSSDPGPVRSFDWVDLPEQRCRISNLLLHDCDHDDYYYGSF